MMLSITFGANENQHWIRLWFGSLTQSILVR